MENKYLKYKYKYLNKKGGAEYYVNPLKIDEYIELLNNKQKIKPEFLDEKEFMESFNNKLILDCEYKSNMMNYFGTCWFIAITMMFFFSDTTRKDAQLNLFETIKKLKKEEISDIQLLLLKNIYPYNDMYFEKGKLKKIYINKLFNLFNNLYKNLFSMLKCSVGVTNICDSNTLVCQLNAVDSLMNLFNESDLKSTDNKILKIKEYLSNYWMKHLLPNEVYEIGNLELLGTKLTLSYEVYKDNNMLSEIFLYNIYIRIYSIILLEKDLYIDFINEINNDYNDYDIIGYLIQVPNHVYCIFQKHLRRYKTRSNSYIRILPKVA